MLQSADLASAKSLPPKLNAAARGDSVSHMKTPKSDNPFRIRTPKSEKVNQTKSPRDDKSERLKLEPINVRNATSEGGRSATAMKWRVVDATGAVPLKDLPPFTRSASVNVNIGEANSTSSFNESRNMLFLQVYSRSLFCNVSSRQQRRFALIPAQTWNYLR